MCPLPIKTVVTLLLGVACTQFGCAMLPSGSKTAANRSLQQKSEIQFALAQSAERNAEFSDAILAYQKVTELDPKHAQAWHRLGLMQDQLGRAAEASNNYRKSLELDSDQPAVWNDLGYSLYLQEQWEPAEAAFQKAIQLAAEDPRTRVNYGLLLARTGREHEAIVQFFHSGISESEAHCNLAVAYLENGEIEQASRQLQMASEANVDGQATEKISSTQRLCLMAQESATRMASQDSTPPSF